MTNNKTPKPANQDINDSENKALLDEFFQEAEKYRPAENPLKDFVHYPVSDKLMNLAVDELIYTAERGILFTVNEFALKICVTYNTARHIVKMFLREDYATRVHMTYSVKGQVGRSPALYRATLNVQRLVPAHRAKRLIEGVESATVNGEHLAMELMIVHDATFYTY